MLQTRLHVHVARASQVPLLLVHEMLGTSSEHDRRTPRHGVDFGAFFSCADGATPADLLSAGIYSSIASPLKGGDLRDVSLAMVLQVSHLSLPHL